MGAVIGGVTFATDPVAADGAQWVETYRIEMPQKLMRKFGAPGVDGCGVKIGGFRGRPIYLTMIALRSTEGGANNIFDALAGTVFSVSIDGTTYPNCIMVSAPVTFAGEAVATEGGTKLYMYRIEALLDQVALTETSYF